MNNSKDNSNLLTTTCPGCSCLCDDIEVSVEDSKIKGVSNACRKGASLFLNANSAPCDIETAIDGAIRILKEARNPAIFGLDNTTLEAQHVAIKLARKLDCMIEDYSQIRYGNLFELLRSSKIPTCTLDEVRDRADISIFWGSDAMNAQPRHLSRFSYFPRGEHKQKGWEFDRHAVTIDLYRSSTAKVTKEYLKVEPGNDALLMNEIMDVLSQKPPRSKDVLHFVNEIRKAAFGVIFAGTGLIQGLNRELGELVEFMQKLNEYGEFRLIPMVVGYNMRGFVETAGNSNLEVKGLFQQALLDDKIDAALIVGADPLSDLPYPVSGKLRDIKTIVIDPRVTPTTEIADVVIHGATPAIDAGGHAMRMDGVEFEFAPCINGELPSDEMILEMILEGL